MSKEEKPIRHSAFVIQARPAAIHGMGGVGKALATIEYACKHADDYRALLFFSADTPKVLHRNIAALCDSLVLNVSEQSEKEKDLPIGLAAQSEE